MIMDEVAPLVDAQVGAFFLADPPEADPTVPERGRAQRLVMCAGYGVVPATAATAQPPSFRLGEGLVGQAAADGRRVLVDDLPAGYLPIRSGVGRHRAARRRRAAGPVRGRARWASSSSAP